MMNILNKTHVLFTAIIVFVAGYANTSQASVLQLTHNPLFLDQSVPPAIAVTLDDSGSMYWSFMGPSGSNGTDFTDPSRNTLYFDPNITYAPPLRADGSQMPNSNPTAAWVDGYPNNMNDTVDLTTGYIAIRRYIYNQNDNNVRISFVDTQERNIANINTTYQNFHPNWTGTNAYYSVRNAANTGWDTVFVTGTDLNNFANWYSYYNSREKLARAAISRAFSGFGPDFKIAWQELNRLTTFSPLEKFETTHRNNFFNWLFRAPTAGGTPLRNSFQRAKELFQLTSSYWNDDFGGNLSCQQNFHIAISDGGWNGGYTTGGLRDETPLAGLPGDSANLYGAYNGSGEQAIYPNTRGARTLSDIAFDSWANDLNTTLNNNVKRFKNDYTDRTGTTIAFGGSDEWLNNAFVWNPKNDPAYWQHVVTYNVGMGLESERVQQYASGNFNTPRCPDQSLADPREGAYLGLRQNQCNWSNGTIDDVWHSSINGRGDFFSANNPTELVSALNSVVNSILERVSRGSKSTTSSGVITDSTRVYSPAFDSANWSGNLFARELDDDGSLGPIEWDASCPLTGGLCDATGNTVPKQPRKVFTYNPITNTRENFDSSLSTVLKSIIAVNGATTISNLSVTVDDIIDYVIGDQSMEQAFGGVFNDRVSVLADIVHSSPYLVRAPSANYDDSVWAVGTAEATATSGGNGYRDFQLANKDRNNTIYIGSNGGMLHAIDVEGSDDGQERWSFIPSRALNNIHRLADPAADHWSYVDNTPVVRDGFFNGDWHSVLVSGMRYGGQSFFALDVTDGNSTEPTVLWEFSDTDDPDMGYSYGQATVVRISSTGEWVALIPNGYNNSVPDYLPISDPRNSISATGNAVMFVVRLSDGQLLTKIDTGEGTVDTPNGLADIVTVDSEYLIPGDNGSKIDYGADFAYAGDLYGNLWRFDLTDSNYSNWSATKLVEANNIKERPITVKPKIVAVPDGLQSQQNDVLVMYATGKYLEPSDRSISLPASQYIVGVVDGLTSTQTNLDMEDSSFIEQSFTTSGGGFYRKITSNPVDLVADNGWKVELVETGERVFNPLTLLGDEVLFVISNVTAGTDPCEAGGRSWLMSMNPFTGGEPEIGELFDDVTFIISGAPQKISGTGSGFLIQDFAIGGVNLTETIKGINAGADGTVGSVAATLQKFTWRRRNWTNLLTE